MLSEWFDYSTMPPHTEETPTEIEALGDTRPERSVDGRGPTNLILEGALRSDIGSVRQRNEDSCLMYSFGSGGRSPLPSFGLYIVADGMGGYDGGDRASKIASRAAAQHLLQQLYLPLLVEGRAGDSHTTKSILRGAVLAAHEALRHSGEAESGGTTLTAALVLGCNLYLAHVGDSRAYWLVDGKLQALTRDHSLVQRLQDEGRLTTEEAQNYQYKNVLLRALGQDDDLEVDVYGYALPADGKLLICSDGLWGPVSESVLGPILKQSLPPGRIADDLIATALKAGGQDNISVIVVEFVSG